MVLLKILNKSTTQERYVDMNEFKQMATVFNKQAKALQDKEQKEILERQARVYNVLGELNKKDLLALFDTGIYNDVVASYLKLAVKKEVDEDKLNKILANLKILFDEKTAGEVVK